MMRSFKEERLAGDGALQHVLSCGHAKPAKCTADGSPAKAQWCRECSPPPAPPEKVWIRREHAAYLLVIISSGLAVGDFEQVERAELAREALSRGLDRPPAPLAATPPDDKDAEIARLHAELEQVRAELADLKTAIDTPHTTEFLAAVKLEAQHQRERWGHDHDASKRTEDWICLLVRLLGKAINSNWEGDRDKLLHHQVTGAAVLMNWHMHATTGAPIAGATVTSLAELRRAFARFAQHGWKCPAADGRRRPRQECGCGLDGFLEELDALKELES